MCHAIGYVPKDHICTITGYGHRSSRWLRGRGRRWDGNFAHFIHKETLFIYSRGLKPEHWAGLPGLLTLATVYNFLISRRPITHDISSRSRGERELRNKMHITDE